MRDQQKQRIRKSKIAIAALMVGAGVLYHFQHQAQAFPADDVLNKMKPGEKQAYLAGIVDGLRQARWIIDKPNADGAVCIRRWFYDNVEKSTRHIEQLMRRNIDKPVETIVFVLVKKQCGWK